MSFEEVKCISWEIWEFWEFGRSMEGVWEFWEDQCLFRKLRSMGVWKDHHCLEYSQLHSPRIARWESLPKHPHFQPNTLPLFFFFFFFFSFSSCLVAKHPHFQPNTLPLFVFFFSLLSFSSCVVAKDTHFQPITLLFLFCISSPLSLFYFFSLIPMILKGNFSHFQVDF